MWPRVEWRAVEAGTERALEVEHAGRAAVCDVDDRVEDPLDRVGGLRSRLCRQGVQGEEIVEVVQRPICEHIEDDQRGEHAHEQGTPVLRRCALPQSHRRDREQWERWIEITRVLREYTDHREHARTTERGDQHVATADEQQGGRDAWKKQEMLEAEAPIAAFHESRRLEGEVVDQAERGLPGPPPVDEIFGREQR